MTRKKTWTFHTEWVSQWLVFEFFEYDFENMCKIEEILFILNILLPLVWTANEILEKMRGH